jgi:alpha-beta hydrolase superfamily lysophospholipase
MNTIFLFIKRLGFYLICAVVLVFATLAITFYLQGRNGPPLMPWHTEHLTEEFTAELADEIRTFSDYRQLEDRLFTQLEEEVYAHTATGPAYKIVRYSAGSAADPQHQKPNWNRSFELPVGTPRGGVLLLHGMSDSPYSLRSLGETLNRYNYWVLGLRMPGHGTAPSGLTSITWEEMALVVKLGMDHLSSKVGEEPIHIIGYSTGAPLALDYALHALEENTMPELASLVLISPAIGVSPAAAMAKWIIRMSFLPGLERLAWLNIQPEFDPYKYNSFTTNAGYQVHRLTRSVAGRIAARAGKSPKEVLPPILVFKSTVDATVSTDAVVDRLLKHLTPYRHELVLFDINRSASNTSLLVSDPAPLTNRLVADQTLPFSLTLITNEHQESSEVIARHKAPFSLEWSKIAMINLAWPRGVISLSHVALPFPPQDPLYGQHPPKNKDMIFLGQIALQGERGLLKIPSDFMLRLRYNPFYAYLESRVVTWLHTASGP